VQNPEYPSPHVVRQNLEEAWRLRSERARERYETASRLYRKLLEAKPEGLIPRHDDPLALARHAESEALAEYTRIVKLFTELTVDGRIPEEGLAARAGGGGD
jgi:hypothetical protein